MKSIRTLKDIESLMRKLAALNRFMFRATYKCHVLFYVMRKGNETERTQEYKKAFHQLKKCLLKAPLLSTQLESDTLYLCLAVSTSSVLVREEIRIQHPVYYIRKTLFYCRNMHIKREKWALALIIAACKLKPYF